jgi:hypothetical protein
MVMKTISLWLCSRFTIGSFMGALCMAILVGCENATSPPEPAQPSTPATASQEQATSPETPTATTKDPKSPVMAERDSAIVPEVANEKDNADLAALAQNTQSPVATEPTPPPSTNVAKNLRKETWISISEMPRDIWDVMYLGNSKIGSMHTEVRPTEGSDGNQLKLTLESLLRVSRGGQSTTQRIAVTSREKLNGEMLDFIATIYEGQNKTEVTGTRLLDDLVIQVTQPNGQSSRSSIPWKPEYRGPFALEQELRQQPLNDGEVREIPYLSVPLFRLAKLVLKGCGKQKVAMLDGSTQELQEVSVTIALDNKAVMETIAWVDDKGETLKSAALGLQVVTYRSSQSSAESVNTAAQADLLKVTSVPLPAGTPNLHLAKALTYNIRCSKDPLKLFASRTNQTVRSAVALECDITVYSVTPDTTLPEALMQQEPPTEADLMPSPMIESADPLILDMAHQVMPEETDPWKIALALERYVHDKIERKDFSRAFATAAEVAKTPRGDCTEHGVLLAALLRARKIPARIASGLVYVDSVQGPTMGYHMWTEAYIGNRWIPLDAVMGKGGIGPGHIKVMDTSLSDQNPYVALLPVLQVLGDLKITSVKAAE